jgi:hypothetical protein
MNKSYLNLGGVTFLILGIFCISSLLLNDKTLPCSINSVELSLSHWLRHWRVLVVGLMPVYVAFTLFGVAIPSLLLGSVLQDWLMGWFGARRID